MSVGLNLQKSVTKIISKFGTIVTLQNVTPVINAYGGVTSTTINSLGTVKAVPSNFFQNKRGRQPFGNLNEGEVRMLFPGGTAFTGLKGTADSWRAVMNLGSFIGTYRPVSEKPIPLTDVNVAIPVTFVLEDENGY